MFVHDSAVPASRVRATGLLFLVVVLSLICAGCGGTTSTSSQPTSTPVTPTATPAPQVLYQADWAHQASAWTLPSHWRIQNGALVNDGKGTDSITVPYKVSAAHYTVVIDMQLSDVTCSGVEACATLGIEARDASGELYFSGAQDIESHSPFHSFSMLYSPIVTADSPSVATSDLTIGTDVRTYTTTVVDNTVTVAFNDVTLGTLTATRPYSPASFQIDDMYAQVTITRLVVTTP